MTAAHVALDQTVDVRVEQGRIVIEPVHRKVYKLDELLRGITSKNLHQPCRHGRGGLQGNLAIAEPYAG